MASQWTLPDEIMSADLPPTSIVETPVEEPLTPPPAGPKPLFYLVGALAGGNVAATALRMIGTVIQGRFVGPAVLGLFNGIGLVLGYAPFLQLGVTNALNRELPYYFGKGDQRRVRELAAAGQAWASWLGGILALGMLLQSARYLAAGDMQRCAGWATNAVLVLTLFYNTNYLQMTYRTSHDFARLALVNVMVNVLALLLVALVALLSFYGLCLRLLIVELTSLAPLYYFRPIRVGPKWNTEHFKHLLAVGLPIFAAGYLYVLWGMLDRTLAFALTGDAGFGLYTQVIAVLTAMEMLPSAFSQVLYPRMAEKYAKTGRLGDLVQMAWKPTLLAALGMIPVIAVSWWCVGPAMRLVLPKYVAAVPAIRWAMLISFVHALASVNVFFLVARRLGVYVGAILCGMAGYGLALRWLTYSKVSLIAFPQAMLVGRIVFVLASYILIAILVIAQGGVNDSRRRLHAGGRQFRGTVVDEEPHGDSFWRKAAP